MIEDDITALAAAAADMRAVKPKKTSKPHEDDLSDLSLDRLWYAFNDPQNRPTPQVTVEAIMFCVRTRGLKALAEPANVARLRDCDDRARTEIAQRTAKLKCEGRIS